MNSSPHHPKVKVSMTLAHSIYVAGKFIAGKMEVECQADKGLGLNVIMVELLAMQGPDLPPSNAVQAHPLSGDPSYPPHYHQARRGISTFLFRIPLPSSAPSSINFGSGLARVRYELRATAEAVWQGEKTLIVCKREIDVVESFEEESSRLMPQGIVVGEFGKIWAQGSVVGGMIIAGESACLELQVKNHSNKKVHRFMIIDTIYQPGDLQNTGLTLSLTRLLVLPGLNPGEISPSQISDNLTTLSFDGPEYIITPGTEGVASLVFDVPEHARGVRAGPYEGDESENRTSESIFEVRCILGITINMGSGTKDIHLDIDVPIAHLDALTEPAESAYLPPEPSHLPHQLQSPYTHSGLPMLPPLPAAYVDLVQNQVWFQSPSHTSQFNDTSYFSPVESAEYQYHSPLPLHVDIPAYVPIRAGPTDRSLPSYATGLNVELVLPPPSQPPLALFRDLEIEIEEGKGERAPKVTQNLRMSSRHRSVSPQSHRFPLLRPPSAATRVPPPALPSWAEQLNPDQLTQSSPSASLSQPTVFLPAASGEPLVHSPRPLLSPKRSIDNLSKSDRVEELERMAEEVEKITVNFLSDLPPTTFEAHDLEPILTSANPVQMQGSPVTESDMHKTFPVPPPAKEKMNDKEVMKSSGRTRIDEFFANAPFNLTAHNAPKTPMTAVTPIKLPSKPKSAEFKALSPNGQAENGLNALEKRLLAEVKMELASEQRPLCGVIGAKPIDIPSKDCVPDDPLNDSAISSLTLAGERIWIDREEVESNEVMDVDAEHDSDEKTHKAGKSIASAGSRKGSRDTMDKRKKKGKKDKDKNKVQDRGRDRESHHTRKKTTAVKGRVAAWLGTIDPDVPPEEDVLPPSPAVPRKISPFIESKEVPSPVVGGDVACLASKPFNGAELKDPLNDSTSATNPRSSGFVPIGRFKKEILQQPFKPLSKGATVVREARRLADIRTASPWAPTTPAPLDNKGHSAILKDVSPAFSLPTPRTVPLIRSNCKVTPLSATGAVDVPGAQQYNIKAGQAPSVNPKMSNANEFAHASPRLAILATPQRNPKYNLRSAYGEREARVTAISSFRKPLRDRVPGIDTKDLSANTDSAVTPKIGAQTSVESHLTATASTIPPLNPGPKPVDVVGKRPQSIIKSTSVPAIISSSHARPTLSSTASLAHPASATPQTHTGKLSSTFSESRPDFGRRSPGQAPAKSTMSSSRTGSVGEMAFGQARLRDLIKKYQGQAA
ncbi:hypothetical protein C0989_006470 [Termitomyces sp. Mn162]|nr:hypothetical protein C0989_006470 [Termitomyces sp. Mn162]